MADTEAPAEEKAGKAKGGKKKLIIVAVVLLLVVGGAAKFLLFKPADSKPAAPPPPEKGAVVKLDPIYLNLAEGRFLKLGIAIQGSKTLGKEEKGEEALDVAIKIFSGKTVKELSDAKERDSLQEDLVKEVQKGMGKDMVLDVYFTEFVMQ